MATAGITVAAERNRFGKIKRPAQAGLFLFWFTKAHRAPPAKSGTARAVVA
jgi:hypothetical protein